MPMSQVKAATLLGISRSTLREWIVAELVEINEQKAVTDKGIQQARELAGRLAEKKDDDESPSGLREQLLKAQVRERNAISRLRELELEHESGRYVELAIVQRDGADAAERILAGLRSIPQRSAMGLQCECRKAAVVEKVLVEEVERVVTELRDSLYLRPRDEVST